MFILRRFILLESGSYALNGSRYIICVIKTASIFTTELVKSIFFNSQALKAKLFAIPQSNFNSFGVMSC